MRVFLEARRWLPVGEGSPARLIGLDPQKWSTRMLQANRGSVVKEGADHRESDAGWRKPMLVSAKEPCGLLGISRSALYEWVAEGAFPPPVRIGERTVRWRMTEIEKWEAALR